MDKPKNLKDLKKRLQPFVNMDNQVRLNDPTGICWTFESIQRYTRALPPNALLFHTHSSHDSRHYTRAR